MTTDKAPFRVEIDGHIAWLILNRPDKRNAMGLDFFPALTEHFQAFDNNPDVRVVVVKAEGKSFTAGLDLVEAGAILSDSTAAGRETLRRKLVELQRASAPLKSAASRLLRPCTATVSAAGSICSVPAISG